MLHVKGRRQLVGLLNTSLDISAVTQYVCMTLKDGIHVAVAEFGKTIPNINHKSVFTA